MAGMREKRFSAAPLLVAALIPAVLLMIYVAGYFWLSEPGIVFSPIGHRHEARIFQQPLWSEIYRPAAMVESAVTSKDVVTATSGH